MEISINSIHSQTMFPLSRHVYSAGLNVYNSSQSAGKIAGIVSAQGSSVAVNYNIGGKLNVYAWLKLLLIFCLKEKIFYIYKTFKKFNILKNFDTIIFAFSWFINNIFWNIIKILLIKSIFPQSLNSIITVLLSFVFALTSIIYPLK